MVFLPCHRFLSCSHAINLLGIFMSYHKCSKAAYHNTVSVAQRLLCEVYEIIHNGLNIILSGPANGRQAMTAALRSSESGRDSSRASTT